MGDFNALSEAVINGDVKGAVEKTKLLLEKGTNVQEIIDNGLISAMDEVGQKFSDGLMFVPQMLRSAKTMQECMNELKPHFEEGTVTTKGKVLIGTVKGDLHDIGKNLVSMMLEGAGFTIIDLGVDVAPEKFVETAQKEDVQIVAMSALLSTTMPSMPTTIEALKSAGLRKKIKIIIGGAPVTNKYAQEIGADSYGSDAGAAVSEVKRLLEIS